MTVDPRESCGGYCRGECGAGAIGKIPSVLVKTKRELCPCSQHKVKHGVWGPQTMSFCWLRQTVTSNTQWFAAECVIVGMRVHTSKFEAMVQKMVFCSLWVGGELLICTPFLPFDLKSHWFLTSNTIGPEFEISYCLHKKILCPPNFQQKRTFWDPIHYTTIRADVSPDAPPPSIQNQTVCCEVQSYLEHCLNTMVCVCVSQD